MGRNAQLNVVAILMVIAAIIMIALGVSHGGVPPIVAGIGFLITAGAFRLPSSDVIGRWRAAYGNGGAWIADDECACGWHAV